MIMNKNLAERMKEYESVSNLSLIKKLPVIIRIDGKQFHTFTQGLAKPFDPAISQSMIDTTKYLCKNIQNIKLGYTQSDEITLVLTDWDRNTTESFLGYKIQKLVSILASMTTMYFNKIFEYYQNLYHYSKIKEGNAMFDARAFNVPLHEVENVLIWRQQDAIRNYVSSYARHLFGHKNIIGKSVKQMIEMLNQLEYPWEKFPPMYKHGVCVKKIKLDDDNTMWDSDLDTPVFLENRSYITEMIE